jgi:hypothetical protein
MPKQQTDASRPPELSDFQKTTQERLRDLFAKRERVASFEIGFLPPTRVTSEEIAIKFTFNCYTSWVYLDGADVIGRNIEKPFEFYDYRSLDELQDAYIIFVEGLLDEDLKQLLELLDSASGTSEPTYDEVNDIRWHTIDPIVERAANDAWNRLKHFTFDADIRARDTQYDGQMRSELKWRSDELKDLLNGKDPHGRRDSKFKRFLKLVGLKR